MMKPKHLRIKGISVMIHFTISQWAQIPRCIQSCFTVILDSFVDTISKVTRGPREPFAWRGSAMKKNWHS